ncbi:antitoxin VbhA family protein [Pseudomonas aeruginosa]
MMQAVEAAKRRSNVAHVEATNNLEGARMSSFMSSKMADYAKGRISSADLVAAARARYGIHD